VRFFHELTPQVLCFAFAAGVTGNLVASLILGTPTVWHLHRKLNRQHRERLGQADVHHAEALTAIRDAAPAAVRVAAAPDARRRRRFRSWRH
jgi:hypothetical protein